MIRLVGDALDYTPVQLAFLFLFYEFVGIVTNSFGAHLAARIGLKATVTGGLIFAPTFDPSPAARGDARQSRETTDRNSQLASCQVGLCVRLCATSA